MTFPEKLDALLEARGWNDSELARQIGVDSAQIGRWRKRATTPSGKVAGRLIALTTGDGDRAITHADIYAPDAPTPTAEDVPSTEKAAS